MKNKLITEKKKLKHTHTTSTQKEIKQKLELKSAATANHLNKKLNKKVSFHLQERTEINFSRKKKVRMKPAKQPEHRKKKNRQNYKRNKKQKKTQKMQELVTKIKEENIVVNLSNEEIPICAYIFLAKGFCFVQSQKTNIHDMRYDTFEFIRKLKWRAFFHQNQDDETETDNTTPPPPPPQHSNIRISNFSNAPFQHPIIDELELKLLGWIANYDAKAPKSNLTECELRGRKWVKDKISSKSIFVTKADKGGAILINICWVVGCFQGITFSLVSEPRSIK